jgi:hypothetical protein
VTVKEFLASLSVGDICKIVTTVIAALTGAFGLGFKLGQAILPAGQAATSAGKPVASVNCGAFPRYPVGRWVYFGRVTTTLEQRYKDNPALGGDMDMSGTRNGTFLTDQAPKKGTDPFGPAKFMFDQDIQPDLDVASTSEDGTGYKARFVGRVTRSGCSISGRFSDRDGNKGELTYFWTAPFQ